LFLFIYLETTCPYSLIKQQQNQHASASKTITSSFTAPVKASIFSDRHIFKLWPKHTWHIKQFNITFKLNPLFITGNAGLSSTLAFF
jgi:hypothetical protein